MIASKNFKRNKKKYKTTVISLFTSIVLFISASSLCSYFKTGISYQTAEYENYDILCHAYDIDDINVYATLVNGIRNVNGIDKIASVNEYALSFCSGEYLSDKAKPQVGEEKGGYMGINAEIRFIDDELFKELLKENNLKEKEYMNMSSPKALLYDENVVYSYVDGKETVSKYSTFDADKLPFDLEIIVNATGYRDESGKGYYFDGTTKEENGKLYFLYSPSVDEGEPLPTEEDMIWVEVQKQTLSVGAVIKESPYYISRGTTLIYPESAEEFVAKNLQFEGPRIYIKAKNHRQVAADIYNVISSLGIEDSCYVSNYAQEVETFRGIILIVNVFAYGFITLISLIAAANVFNTISTNIYLRKREFAMLKSVGMTEKDFSKMMNFESILYGFKSLLYGLPVSAGLTYVFYYIVKQSGFDIEYYLPYESFAVAVISVFIVVFASMIYAMKKTGKENVVDALKNENI